LKNKFLRKALSALTAAVVALSALPLPVLAEEQTAEATPAVSLTDTQSVTEVASAASTQMRGLTAIQIVNDMGAGWNLGNSLESDNNEEYWGNPVTTKAMIDDIADAGFTTLRVPVRWDDHYTDNNYTIDSTYMARVEEVVNYGLDNDMYVILNVHHNDLQHNVPNTEAISAELSAIWKQIANHFKNYGDKLIFEVNNEPRAGDDWTGNATYYQCVNDCNEAARAAIRATGGNNTQRLVMLPTYCASGDYVKAAAWTKNADDDMIAVSIHAYLPYDFAFEGTGHTDWRYSDEQELQQFFDRMDKLFLKKGIPVVIGEFGTRYKHVDNTDDRNTHASVYASIANMFAEQSIPCVWWDNNCFTTNGENFGIYDRNTREWVYKDIATNLIGNYYTEPSYDVYTEGVIQLASNVSCSGWGQAASFDASTLIMLDEDDTICCDYESDSAPQFIMQSFTNNSKGWVQVAPESNNGNTASWSRSYLLEKFGGTFDDLGKIYIGDTGAALTASSIYIPQCENHWHDYTGKQTITVPATATTPGRRLQECTYKDCKYEKVTTFTESNVDASLPAPELEACFYVNGQVFLSWSGVSDITGYNIYRSTSADGEKTLIHTNTYAQQGYFDTDITEDGATYYYCVTAYNSDTGKESEYSNVMSVDIPKLYDMIRFDSVTSSSVTLSWDAIDGMTYRVYCSTTPGSIGVNNLITSMDGITETTLKITGLTPNTTYYFAIVGIGNGTITSKEVSTTTKDVPKPANIKTATGDGQVTLTWDKTDDASKYAVSLYNASTGKYNTLSTSITGTSYTVTGLTNGTKYQFLVQAYAGGTWSKYTTADHVSATPNGTKPTDIEVTTASGKVTLNWNAVEGATKYAVSIYKGTGNNYNTLSTSITGTSYTATGLTNGTTYQFLVQAYVGGKWSTFTTADHVSVTPNGTKPSGIKATTASGKVTLNWNAVEGATKYAVSIYKGTGTNYNTLSTSITGTSYTATGLTNGTTYQFLVQAYVGGKWNTFTTADHVSATPVGTAKPTNIKATAGDGQVTLTWSAVSGATKYAVSIYKGTGTNYTILSKTITGTSYTATGLTNGTTYQFLVQAYVGGKWSTFTTADHVSATPVGSNVKPTNIKATAGNGQVTLTWDKVTGATKYAVSIYLGTGTRYNTLTTSITGTSYTATGLTNGTTYQFLVQAYVGGKWNTFTTADHVSATPTA